ncbi:MAG TPA: gliding motility-associated C-terminal domain-containing protein, partial [Chitinophagaceae bacterium]|nr:gliding motility-associated C-terminal domain-containing protein [Chitinophagaceae bacterium]
NSFWVGNHAYSLEGQYTDSFLTMYGCDSIIHTQLDVLATEGNSFFIPNAFSPNNDGLNDCFGVTHWLDIEEFKCVIYNRFGNQVYSSTGVWDCWNGNFAGQEAEQGTYFYYIKARTACGQIERKGDLLLLR